MRPVEKRAERSLILVRVSVKQTGAGLSPALLRCSSGGEDRQVSQPPGECGVMRKMREEWAHRGGSPEPSGGGAVWEGGGVHIVSEGGRGGGGGEGSLGNTKQKSQSQECGIRGGGQGLQWKMQRELTKGGRWSCTKVRAPGPAGAEGEFWIDMLRAF